MQEQFQKAGDTVREKAPEVAAGVQSAAADAVSAGREKFSDLTHGDADEVPVGGGGQSPPTARIRTSSPTRRPTPKPKVHAPTV